jgi:hypothetical protein
MNVMLLKSMKSRSIQLLVVLWICIFAQTVAIHAQITEDQKASVVRIFAFGFSKPNQKDIDLSSGTGFLIDSEGDLMTNNHVIASKAELADHPYTYLVLQRKGTQFFAYYATFIAQNPNSDLAVIRCSNLKGTPFQLLLPPPHEIDEVFSMGYPGVADPSGMSWATLLVALKQKLDGSGSAQAGAEVTDVINSNPLWAGFASPTVTNGKVEKVTEIPGTVGGVNAKITVIEHSCNIRHGNSGGPLLNGGGQVVGVVGDAWGGKDAQYAQQSAATNEIQSFLNATPVKNCNFTTKAWVAPHFDPAAIIAANRFDPKVLIIAISIAIALAIAALVVVMVRGGKKTQTSVTTLIQELKKRGAALGSAILPPPIPPNGWQLTGRTPAGASVRFDINPAMFTNNGNKLVLGRAGDICHVVVNDGTVSRQHAHIKKTSSGFTVADRNSSNGTAVNGQFSRQPFNEVPLKVGDTLTLGEVKLDFKLA